MERRTIPKPTIRDEWLAARAPFIGASESAALVGAHPFITLDELAAVKLVQAGTGGTQPETDAMRRGTFLESAVADWWAADNGADLVEPTDLYVYGETFIATLDRRVVDTNTGVEIKTTNHHVTEPAPYWYWQVQTQMLCAGLDRVHVVVLDPSMTLQTFTVEPDANDQARLVTAGEAFMFHVRRGEVPPNVDVGYRAASVLHPSVTQETTELDPDTYRMVRCLALVNARIKSLEADADAIKGMVAHRLGDAAVGTVDGNPVVTWRSITRMDLDRKALRADHPDLARAYSHPTTYRQLRLK